MTNTVQDDGLVDFDTFLIKLNERVLDSSYNVDDQKIKLIKDKIGLTKFMTAPVIDYNGKMIVANTMVFTELDSVIEKFQEFLNEGKQIFIYTVLQQLSNETLPTWKIRFGLT